MVVIEHYSVVLPAQVFLEQVALPVGFHLSSLLLLLLVDHLVLHGREASMGSHSSVHILLDLKYIVFTYRFTTTGGELSNWKIPNDCQKDLKVDTLGARLVKVYSSDKVYGTYSVP